MSKKEKYARFEEVYNGSAKDMKGRPHLSSSIYRDNETGVLYHLIRETSGFTPLFDSNGKILVDHEFLRTKADGNNPSVSSNEMNREIKYSEEEEKLFNKFKDM